MKLPPEIAGRADYARLVRNAFSELDTRLKAVGGSVWGAITGTLSDQADLQAALDAKAPLASPALTGTPTAPTAAGGTNTTQIATTAFVQSAIAPASPSAPTLTVGTAAGSASGGTATVDAYGEGWATVTLTTGSTVGSGDALTVTYPTAYSAASIGFFLPASATAATAAGLGRSGYISSQTTSGFTIAVNGATILAASTVYKINLRWTGK